MKTLFFFRINFNNDENKFPSLACGCRNTAAILDKFDANEVSIFSFKKNAFVDRVFTLMFTENNPCRFKNFLRCYSI